MPEAVGSLTRSFLVDVDNLKNASEDAWSLYLVVRLRKVSIRLLIDLSSGSLWSIGAGFARMRFKFISMISQPLTCI